MEDIRKLLNDDEALINVESLAYVLRGLSYALSNEFRHGTPTDPDTQHRHLEVVSALTHCTELYSTLLARWMGTHRDRCKLN